MTHFEKKIEKTILFQTSEVFPNTATVKGQIIKVEEEPHSFWVDRAKLYIFEIHEVPTFLSWYWHNCKETFIFDIVSNGDNKITWKYFCKTVSNFAMNYPSVEVYNANVIEHKELITIFENIINVNGVDAFINDFILTKKYNKLMDFKKTQNTIYKFATNCGKQIFK